MANSDFLRKNKNQHSIKNSISKKMDKGIDLAVQKMIKLLKKQFPKLIFEHQKSLSLVKIIDDLSLEYPQFKDDFSNVLKTSFIKPDGGFLYASDKNGNKKLILVAEVKHQGTNDKRVKEGLKKQAKGNAIERLGKNLTGIKIIFKSESMIPFICFGNGDDFKEGSSIRDRVITMNEFFPLNTIYSHKEHLPFEPVSMFFREKSWSVKEMTELMTKIAIDSINYHFK